MHNSMHGLLYMSITHSEGRSGANVVFPPSKGGSFRLPLPLESIARNATGLIDKWREQGKSLASTDILEQEHARSIPLEKVREDQTLGILERSVQFPITNVTFEDGMVQIQAQDASGEKKPHTATFYIGQNSMSVVEGKNFVTLLPTDEGVVLTYTPNLSAMRKTTHSYNLSTPQSRDRFRDIIYRLEDVLNNIEESPFLFTTAQNVKDIVYGMQDAKVLLSDMLSSSDIPPHVSSRYFQRLASDFTEGFRRGYALQTMQLMEAKQERKGAKMLEEFLQQFSAEGDVYVSKSQRYLQFDMRGERMRIHVGIDGEPTIQVGPILPHSREEIYTLSPPFERKNLLDLLDMLASQKASIEQEVLEREHAGEYGPNLTALKLLTAVDNYLSLDTSTQRDASKATRNAYDEPTERVAVDIPERDPQKAIAQQTLHGIESYLDSLLGILPLPPGTSSWGRRLPEYLFIGSDACQMGGSPNVKITNECVELNLPNGMERVHLYISPINNTILLKVGNQDALSLDIDLEKSPEVHQELLRILQRLQVLFTPLPKADLEKITYIQRFEDIREMLRSHAQQLVTMYQGVPVVV